MSDNEDFEEQLRLEELEKEQTKSLEKGNVYTDEDGTTFEWDPAKKAYFPKIDQDFIASYQASYGVETDFDKVSEKSKEELAYWNYYRQWHSQVYPEKSQKKSGGDSSDVEEKLRDAEAEHKSSLETWGDPQAFFAWYSALTEQQRTEWYESLTEEQRQSYWEYYTQYAGYYSQQAADASKAGESSGDGSTKVASGQKRKQEASWFDVEGEKNTNIYVSNLPSDVTHEEFQELMSKCGLMMQDPDTKQAKIKLYKDEEGNLKGDGLCTYLKFESVKLAEQLLHESEFKGRKINVEQAKFSMKGEFDPSLKKKRKKQDKQKIEKMKEKLLDWRPDKLKGSRYRYEKTVVLKNMFEPKEFERDASLILELKADMRDECAKYGEVKKVEICDRNEDGVVLVTFKLAEEADVAVAALNGRWFAKRRITAAHWDGKTKYRVEETEEEKAKRLKEWEEYLAKGGDPSSRDNTVETTSEEAVSAAKEQSNSESGVADRESNKTIVKSKQSDSVSVGDGEEKSGEKIGDENLPSLPDTGEYLPSATDTVRTEPSDLS